MKGQHSKVFIPTIHKSFFTWHPRGEKNAKRQNSLVPIVNDTNMVAKRTFEVGVQVALFIVVL
jgi:hypothetical protein